MGHRHIVGPTDPHLIKAHYDAIAHVAACHRRRAAPPHTPRGLEPPEGDAHGPAGHLHGRLAAGLGQWWPGDRGESIDDRLTRKPRGT